MAEKGNRRQYKRKWMSASRSLRKVPTVALSNDSVESVGCNTEYDFQTVEVNNLTPENVAFQCENETESSYCPSYVPCSSSIPIGFDDFLPSSSESETDDHNMTDMLLAKDLSVWATQFNVAQNAIDKLLKLLQKAGHRLPSTARGLLKPEKCVSVDKKSDMQYVYLGFNKQLEKYLKGLKCKSIEIVSHFEISLNVDGLPLYKSSNICTWPILCAIMNVQPVHVFPVALCCGSTKPNNLDFLTDTITDLNELLMQGFIFDECLITVSLRCIVCDAPAKAMVKAVKLYSGYAGCDKCSQRGNWQGRMTYPDIDNIELRTDESFRSQIDTEHHHNTSPFCKLPIDMISTFPLDYMHQCCLGVMKKLLLAWLRGNVTVKISAVHSNEISMRMLELRKSIPNIFARKPRTLVEIDRWKATELRLFLLYIGKIVLKKILRDDLYQHFLTFSVAMCILVSPTLVSKYSQYAHELLVHFVKECKRLYGDEFLIYNVHCLLHLSSEAKKFGCLDNCSAFPFENYLQRMKKMVRSGKNPIVQIVKRLSELKTENIIKQAHAFSRKTKNNCFILENSLCCEVLCPVSCMHERGEEELCLQKCKERLFKCRIYEKSESLFNKPCDSRIIETYLVHARDAVIKHIPKSRLKTKAVMVDMSKKSFCFMAVLHDIHS